MVSEPEARLAVHIQDGEGAPIASATVVLERQLEPDGNGNAVYGVPLSALVTANGTWAFDRLSAGLYRLTVTAVGYDDDTRTISFGGISRGETVVLGQPGDYYVYARERRVPIRIAGQMRLLLVLEAGYTAGALDTTLSSLSLVEEASESVVPDHGRMLVRFTQQATASAVNSAISSLNASSLVVSAHLVVDGDNNIFRYLSNMVITGFDPTLSASQRAGIAAQFDMDVDSVLNEDFGTVVLLSTVGAGPAFLANTDALRSHSNVRMVQNVVHQTGDCTLNHVNVADHIPATPGPLHFQCWHLRLMDVQKAWSRLSAISAAGAGNLTYGNAGLIADITDYGIPNVTDPITLIGVSAHPYFLGNVSNGNPRLRSVFDFRRIVPNHTQSGSNHGTQSTGMFGGRTDQGEGGSGVAGNVQLIATIPATSPQMNAQRMLWTFGDDVAWDPATWQEQLNDAGRVIGNLPTQQLRGADLNSNSFVLVQKKEEALHELHGALLYAVTYGRSGRGGIVAFAVGNGTATSGGGSGWIKEDQKVAMRDEVLAISGIMLEYINADNSLKERFPGAALASYSRIDDADYYIDFSAPRESSTIHGPPQQWQGMSSVRIGAGSAPGAGGIVDTVLATAAAIDDVVLHLGGATGLVAEQKILVGNPGPDALHEIEAVVTHDRVKLVDELDVAFAVNTPVRAISESMTTGTGAAGQKNVTLGSVAGMLVGQKILIGSPTSAQSTASVIDVVGPGNQITLRDNLVSAASNADVYFLGGPGGSTVLTTTLSVIANAGSPTITIPCTAGFHKGQGILLEPPGSDVLARVTGKQGEWEYVTPSIEMRKISSDVTSPTVLTIADPGNIARTHSAGADVVGGTPNYSPSFAGTSMACPLAAGVMALVLSAKMKDTPGNSSLTWREVRDIVRRTSEKIDLLNIGMEVADSIGSGIWYNVHRQPVVRANAGVPELIPAAAFTTMHSEALVGAFLLDVEDARDFTPGHAILIRSGANSFSALVRSVPDRHTIRLDRPLATAYPAGAAIDSGNATVVAVNGVEVTLNTNQQLAEGQAVKIGAGGTAEIRYIRELPPTISGAPNITRIFIDRPLHHPHVGDAVAGGRIPLYNHFYGRGRINADWAVEMAINYSHNERDLMIRNNPNDDGVTFVNRTPIDSPDIWTRNADPYTEAGALPISRDAAAPHQVPSIAADKWVCARVINRGSSQSNLRAKVRFFVALAPSTPPPGSSRFAFPTDYRMREYDYESGLVLDFDAELRGLYVNKQTKSFFLGEVFIEEDTIAHTNDTTRPNFTSVAVKWPAGPASFYTDDKIFLLVQVSPHDGVVIQNGAPIDACDTPVNCNNLTYRELSFTDIRFRGPNGDALPDAIQVDTVGNALETEYSIEARDVRRFDPANMQVVISRTTAGPPETVTITYTGGAWSFQPAPLPWLTMPTQPSPGLTTSAVFSGKITLSSAHAGSIITMHAEIREAAGGAVRLASDHTIAAYKLDGVPSSVEMSRTAPQTRLHAFADMARLREQSAEDSFGPKSDNLFRLTSRFRSVDVASVTAYAVTRGLVLVQPVDDTFVNLVLRPLEQTALGGIRVKYFIYRGLLKENFVGVDATKLIPEDDDNATEFIKSLYEYDERLSSALGVTATTPLPARVIGYDPNASRDTKIEQYFFHVDSEVDPKKGYQLALVQRGMVIGKFGAAGFGGHDQPGFGFEIILDDGTYEEDIAYVRKRWADIDLGLITNPQEKLAARERVLRYLDPAAYYGMHYYSGAYVRVVNQSSRLFETSLYDTVISKFATRDTVYLDVRNENGCSYNYYGNYGLGTNPLVNIKVGNRPLANTQGAAFGDYGWPVIRYTQTSTTKESANALFVSLRIDDNTAPMAYVEGGYLAVPGARRRTIGETALVPGTGGAWTNDIPIVVPNRSLGLNSTTAANVAGLVRLHYFRVHRAPVPGAPLPPQSVVKSTAYHDLAFGPIDATPPWATIPGAAGAASKPVTWDSNADRVFVDAVVAATNPANQMGYVAERGVAREDSKVVFYAAAREQYYWAGTKTPQTAVLVGGVANTPAGRTSFLNVAALYLNELKLKNTEVTLPDSSKITLFNFEERDHSGDYPASNFLALGISTTQRDALAALPGFSPRHARYIVAQKVADRTSGATAYYEYKLGVRGWGTTVDAATGRHAMYEFFPTGTATITVYSLDGLIFTSKDFSDLEATVTPPAVAHTPEERVYLDEGIPKEIIAASPLHANVVAFQGEIATLAGTPQTFATLKPVIEFHGDKLFQDAVSMVGVHDDRPLYWARLAMRAAMRDAGLPQVDELITVLEETSRGLARAPFPGEPNSTTKHILVVGFDPYMLHNGANANIRRANPGAAAVLRIAYLPFTSPGNNYTVVAHALILPMRYADYDVTGEASIEHRFFNDFFDPSFPLGLIDNRDGPHKIHAVITVAPGPASAGAVRDYFIARFATKTRGGDEDNNGVRSTSSAGLVKGDDFYDASLPLTTALPASEGGPPIIADLYFDQTYQYTSSKTGPQQFTTHKRTSYTKAETAGLIAAPNAVPTDASGDLSGGVGSAGNWLFNEVYYRLARMHNKVSGRVKVGHIIVPALQGNGAAYNSGPDYSEPDTVALAAKVRDIIAAIADGL